MTIQEDVDDIMARLRHALQQREYAAREWERQAAQWEGVAIQQRTELDALQEELATLAHAAHMPNEYQYGLPSWINQVLYAAYIGADIGPHNRAWAIRLEERWETAMLQIRDAHNALNAAGVPSEKHEAHEGCPTQLGHRIRDLIGIINTETPIAAFSLAETWRTEKAGYMERIEALTLALDEQAELQASAELAVTRWKRSEAVRKAAVDSLQELTTTHASLSLAAQAVVDSAGRESEDVRLVSTSALGELARCVSSTGVGEEPAPLEETRFVEHPIHPYYGPCDGMGAGGNCYECEKVFGALKKRISELEETQAGCPHCGRGRLGEGI